MEYAEPAQQVRSGANPPRLGRVLMPVSGSARVAADVTRPAEQHIGHLPDNSGFVAMLTAYRGTGGVARSDDLARLMEDRNCGSFVSLARLIVTRAVFAFEWRHTSWIPMFQFDLSDLSIRPGPQRVVAELGSEFDNWALAAWFARPNSWLNNQAPVELMESRLAAVLDAARADRFIATG